MIVMVWAVNDFGKDTDIKGKKIKYLKSGNIGSATSITTLKPVFLFTKTVLTCINANAAVTLLEQSPEKISGSERDSNPRPLRCRCSALQSHS